MVHVRDLTVGYADATVLQKVTARFPRKEISVVLGASGSGKTTLLRNLIGLLRPQEGDVFCFGDDISTMDEKKLNSFRTRIGVLFQNGALLNSVSVFDNVRIPLEQHTNLPRPVIDAMVHTKLALVELADSGSALPAELSGGMRKRAGLARAIALDPELLLCDEPSSGLDPLTSAALDSLLVSLRDTLGVTMIIISHDIASVRRIADRVFFLHEGRILFEGSVEEAESSQITEVATYFATGG
jgi:phospholipid/cholesterol/gamma-HCH transport system ATP-binding protein